MDRFVKLLMRCGWLLLGLGALSACTVAEPTASSTRRATQDDLFRLHQSQADLARQVEQLQNTLMLLEARFRDQQQVIEQLRQEKLAKKVTPVGERAESGPKQAASGGETEAVAATLNPTETYLQAFSDYAAGRYPQCIDGFQTFLQYFPANEYAANAQFWLGECYYSQQRYGLAVIEFKKMAEEYPQGSKAPEALWKTALAYEQLGQEDRAREALNLLMERYQDSPAAKKARDRTR